jgi:hypothetical protein
MVNEHAEATLRRGLEVGRPSPLTVDAVHRLDDDGELRQLPRPTLVAGARRDGLDPDALDRATCARFAGPATAPLLVMVGVFGDALAVNVIGLLSIRNPPGL